jgi:hypothetical protein
MTKGRNVVRVVVVIWLALAIRTGFVGWDSHVNAVVQGAPTAVNLSGQVTENIEFRCAAPLRADKPPVQVDPQPIVSGPTPAPCSLRTQRQGLFWVDVAFGLVTLGASFAHMPRRWSLDHRAAVASA